MVGACRRLLAGSSAVPRAHEDRGRTHHACEVHVAGLVSHDESPGGIDSELCGCLIDEASSRLPAVSAGVGQVRTHVDAAQPRPFVREQIVQTQVDAHEALLV